MNLWSLFHQLNSKPIEILEGRCHKAGSEINFFWQLPTGAGIFFQSPNEKNLQRNTSQNYWTGLPAKYSQSM